MRIVFIEVGAKVSRDIGVIHAGILELWSLRNCNLVACYLRGGLWFEIIILTAPLHWRGWLSHSTKKYWPFHFTKNTNRPISQKILTVPFHKKCWPSHFTKDTDRPISQEILTVPFHKRYWPPHFAKDIDRPISQKTLTVPFHKRHWPPHFTKENEYPISQDINRPISQKIEIILFHKR